MNSFFDSILDFGNVAGRLTVESILLCLLATFVLSQVIAWVYLWTHRGISYTSSVVQSLIVLSLIVAIVMSIIGSNIARAFGLFGALALIRFRTPVKDTRDTVFLFLAVALGIATGTGNILTGLIGTLFVCLVLVYLSVARFGSRLNHDGLLRFLAPVGGQQEKAINEVLDKYCDSVRLLHLREAAPEEAVEHSIEIRMIDTRLGSRLMAEIRMIEGISNVSLLMRDAESTP